MAIIHGTKDNFEKEVLKSEVPVLVDFWAAWCGPCKALGPILENVAEEATNGKVVKVNVDEEPELASQYRIMSIPTVILFKNGEAISKSVGLVGKDELIKLMNK